jgi:hypothetical protein
MKNITLRVFSKIDIQQMPNVSKANSKGFILILLKTILCGTIFFRFFSFFLWGASGKKQEYLL